MARQFKSVNNERKKAQRTAHIMASQFKSVLNKRKKLTLRTLLESLRISRLMRQEMSSGSLASWLVDRLSSTMLHHVPMSGERRDMLFIRQLMHSSPYVWGTARQAIYQIADPSTSQYLGNWKKQLYKFCCISK